MAKRLFDILFASAALVVSSPLWLFAAIGILLSSPGPLFYRAQRAGVGGRPFTMHKFRTMHHRRANAGPAITATGDPRIFPFGAVLRKLKIDELPQLLDVLRGEMAIVGPRPEDVGIVEAHYTERHRRTLSVRPGVTSVGAIYGYRNESAITGLESAEADYLDKVLDAKLERELAYIESAPTVWSDLRVIVLTAVEILRQAASALRKRA